ncbi:hypothetical protein V7122_19420 [Bacillus sp. JJ1532]|uniref:hypothetical protein n=1 Tax=Bacillus sp. JJ1532 TaxID=3122958 RepID=UPI002FFD64AD
MVKEILFNSVESIALCVSMALLLATLDPMFAAGVIIGCVAMVAVIVFAYIVSHGITFKWRKKK